MKLKDFKVLELEKPNDFTQISELVVFVVDGNHYYLPMVYEEFKKKLLGKDANKILDVMDIIGRVDIDLIRGFFGTDHYKWTGTYENFIRREFCVNRIQDISPISVDCVDVVEHGYDDDIIYINNPNGYNFGINRSHLDKYLERGYSIE